MPFGGFGKCIVIRDRVWKMSDKEIDEFIKMFKGVMPDPDNYPKTFDYYYNLYKHIKEK